MTAPTGGTKEEVDMRTMSNTTKVLVGACIALAVPMSAAGIASAQPATTATTSGTTTTTTASGLPAPTPPAAAPADNCVKADWPTMVEGRPTAFKAGDHGVYLWQDPDNGWALRVTHAGLHDKVIFSGTLTTSGQFVDVKRVKDEPNDVIAVSANKETIKFRFVNYGWIDGLNFATHCSTGFTASFSMDGQVAPVSKIHLGVTVANPPTNPFRVERLPQSAVVSS